jgi:hypothetical protein
VQIAIDPHARIAEIYTYDTQLKASFTLGEGRYGSSTGVDDLRMAIEGSNAPAPDIGHAFAPLYAENRREVDGKMGGLRNEGSTLDVATLLRGDKESTRQVLQMSMRQVLQMPEEEREIVLKYLANCINTG